MKTLNGTYIAYKNLLSNKSPWIWLFEIEIDSSATWRLAGYPEDITWNSETWTAFPCIVERIVDIGSGRIQDINIHVSNVTRNVSAYVENANLLGNDVTIYIVNHGDLSVTSDVLTFTYRINRIHTTDQVATFELGHDDLFSLRLPWQRFIRDKCRWVYKDSRCRYPDDEFDAISTRDIAVGGDGDKEGGWAADNTANTVYMDINTTLDDYYVVQTDAATRNWNDGTTDGPWIYKEFAGDFDIETRLRDLSATTHGGPCLIIQSPTDTTDWYLCGHLDLGGGTDFLFRNTTNGSTVQTSDSINQLYWRVTRVGTVITTYNGPASGTWTQRDQETRSDFPTTLRVGLGAFSVSSTGSPINRFDYFRVNSGGLATCDYTLDGNNGCRVHSNTVHYGGFPGIPNGRLHGF